MNKPKLMSTIQPYLYVLPMAVVFGIFSVYPIVHTLYLSFTDSGSTISNFHFVGMRNYIDMFHGGEFLTVLKNTLIFSVSTVLLTVLIGLLFAAVANSEAVRFKGLFRMATFYPYILPSTVAAMVWIYMYNPTRGIINMLFGTNIQWLNSYTYSLPALIVVQVWKSLGFNFLLILSGMQNISPEYYDAASLETNSGIKKFLHITLPLLKPTLSLTTLLAVTSSFQSMDLVAIMTQGKPGNSTNVLAYYVYQQGIIYGKVGFGSAVSFVLLLSLLIFTVLYLRMEKGAVSYDQ